VEGDPVLPVFSEWLKAFRASGVPDLVLLGDLFRIWIALESAETDDQKKVLRELADLASEGRRVVYVVGNRDYFAREAGRARGLEVAECWDLCLPGGGRMRFEHGDGINTSDRQYLRWRRLSRSAPMRWAFLALPGACQRRLARRLERRFTETNLEYKAYDPARELEAWAARLAGEGVRAAVVGHFHREEEREAAGVRIRLMPQFREEGLHLRVRADGSLAVLSFSRGPG
jgi:UDP-2,3-diacylglucosamine pyrophosphatase LpxH